MEKVGLVEEEKEIVVRYRGIEVESSRDREHAKLMLERVLESDGGKIRIKLISSE